MGEGECRGGTTVGTDGRSFICCSSDGVGFHWGRNSSGVGIFGCGTDFALCSSEKWGDVFARSSGVDVLEGLLTSAGISNTTGTRKMTDLVPFGLTLLVLAEGTVWGWRFFTCLVFLFAISCNTLGRFTYEIPNEFAGCFPTCYNK